MSNSARSDFWKSGLEGAGAAEPHHVVVLHRIEDLDAGRVDELLPLLREQAPDVAAPLEMVVDGHQLRRRLAVRDQAAPRVTISGRCSTPTGHSFWQAPQVVHCHNAGSS